MNGVVGKDVNCRVEGRVYGGRRELGRGGGRRGGCIWREGCPSELGKQGMDGSSEEWEGGREGSETGMGRYREGRGCIGGREGAWRSARRLEV